MFFLADEAVIIRMISGVEFVNLLEFSFFFEDVDRCLVNGLFENRMKD